MDIVAIQLSIAQGVTLAQLGLTPGINFTTTNLPGLHSIQFRLAAESIGPSNKSSTSSNDATSNEGGDGTQVNWALSIGKIQHARFPQGNGIRVDSHIVAGQDTIITSDFDSVIAKIIVTAPTWQDVVRKAQRALRETKIVGVKTNLDVLRAIAADEAFRSGICDTRWLEGNQSRLVEEGRLLTERLEAEQAIVARGVQGGRNGDSSVSTSQSSNSASFVNTTLMFRKGDAWSITLLSKDEDSKTKTNPSPTSTSVATTAAPTHHLELSRVLRNEFPASMSADVTLSSATDGSSAAYTMHLASTSSSSVATLSQHRHRRGDPGHAGHVVAPFSGKLMEVLVDEGDVVKQGDVVCVIRQMKMELEVRSPRAGTVTWVCEVEDEEEIGEGVLVCELVLDSEDGMMWRPKL